MRAIFPGQPAAKLQAVTTALWDGNRIVAYICRNALIVLRGPNDLVQSITHGEDDILEAVAVSEASGKIAACTKEKVFVYDPIELGEGTIRAHSTQWSLQHTLTTKCSDKRLASLSWGQPREVLAGGAYLTLFDTGSETSEIWSRDLANPVKCASFTPDASFIASYGWEDRLVKIWRRLFLGENEERFDVSYLPHSAAVTGARWHRRPNQEYHSDTVLYTTCGDLKLRIWAATDPRGLQALQLWSELDLDECVIPQTPAPPGRPAKRYVFIMDGWEFEATIEHAVRKGEGGERETHTREHLMDVAYRNPDVCVVMDGIGNMSAWGLERVGCKARQQNDIFNIAVVEDLKLNLLEDTEPQHQFVCLYDFGGIEDGTINVLAHFFDGRVEWLKAPVDRLFDSFPAIQRFSLESIWTGHSEAVSLLSTNRDSSRLLSQGSDNEVVLWTQSSNAPTTLERANAFSTPEKVIRSSLSASGLFAALSYEDSLSIWSLTGSKPTSIYSEALDSSPPKLLASFPTVAGTECFVAISHSEARLWSLGHSASSSTEVAITSTPLEIEGFIDEDFRQAQFRSSECAVWAMNPSGTLSSWIIDHELGSLKRKIGLETGITKAPNFAATSTNMVAIVDPSQRKFCIWNFRFGDSDFEKEFAAHETIGDIQFMVRHSEHDLLAVSVSHKAFVYASARRSFSDERPAWIILKTVDIGELTSLPILASSWLVNSDLLLAAGNQLFVSENTVQVPRITYPTIGVNLKDSLDRALPVVMEGINGSCVSFHPELLYQQVLVGQCSTADEVLLALHEKLKYWTVGEYLPSRISVESHKNSDQPTANGHNSHSDSEDGFDGSTILSEDRASSLTEIMEGHALPYLSIEEQTQLANLVTSIGSLERHRKATDDAGLRYLIRLRLRGDANTDSDRELSYRDILSAYHSTTQEVLVDLSSRSYHGKMLWKDARQCGLFMWLNDIEAVRTQFENIARNEYTKTDAKNPIDCTLHYLALRKKQVLVGLWRMATWNKEQRATQRMLANNFNDPRWQTAAMKNAYALLGLRRFEYAAAFFLLADRPKDAVNILASQVKDIQLAIAVARVYDGDNGPVLRELLQERILPQAAREGKRWLASWAFWMLGQKAKALRALVVSPSDRRIEDRTDELQEPLEKLIGLQERPTVQAKSYRNNEPALVHCYEMLREKIRKTPGDKTQLLSPQAEHDLVLRSAMGYVRGGCHVLALDLVRIFRFSKPAAVAKRRVSGAAHTTYEDVKAKDARLEDDETEDQEEAPVPEPALTTLDAPAQRKKVVAEPSAASILDSFDF